MKKIFEILKNRRESNKNTMLITITDSKGSVPRTTGAYMLVGEEGIIYGTIGGGRMEFDAGERGKELLKSESNFIHDYSMKQGVSELGLVCGGSAVVLFYCVSAKDEDFINRGLKAVKGHRPYYIVLPTKDGDAKIRFDITDKPTRFEFCENGNEYFAERFNYDGRVYIFGGGHISRECVPLLSHLGFSVVVIDDRDEFANAALFPDADEVILSDFTDLEDKLDVHENDYIAVMTRGHKGDKDCEKFALGTGANYIGVVGSRAKTEFVNARLVEEGVSLDEIKKRVTTPIGLDIGSETPAEIAVSIAAQLIRVRAEKIIV